ncbi:hypothetical protein EDC26_10681 [Paralcaligenes ureilyticus]|uniref:Uncharacterized protein n=1 Tax=Paralcaligenes ureilyticus TaxID=627131 RepID=A0A4R3M708_9BURK|nr:hypothetical protein EDC26_10681 [Paralcaligenes ureilyticus]
MYGMLLGQAQKPMDLVVPPASEQVPVDAKHLGATL